MAVIKIKIDENKYDWYNTDKMYESYCGKCSEKTKCYEYHKFDGGGILICSKCTPPEKLKEIK